MIEQYRARRLFLLAPHFEAILACCSSRVFGSLVQVKNAVMYRLDSRDSESMLGAMAYSVFNIIRSSVPYSTSGLPSPIVAPLDIAKKLAHGPMQRP